MPVTCADARSIRAALYSPLAGWPILARRQGDGGFHRIGGYSRGVPNPVTDEEEAWQMRRMTTFCFAIAAACVAAVSVSAREPAPVARSPASARPDALGGVSYSEPLAKDVAGLDARPRSSSPGLVPVFPSGPTSGERISTALLGFAATSAFSLAANRTGTARTVPPPSYAPYRPGMPMPEPGAEAIACQPSGALTTPATCAGR